MIYHAKKFFTSLTAAISLLFVLSPVWAGTPKKFAATALTAIEIRLSSGQVQLMAWNGDQVTVESLKKDLPISTVQGVLKIGPADGQPPKSINNVKVYAPQHLVLTVVTDNASVSVQGFSNRVQITTMGGDVNIVSCSAPLEVETVGGDIDTRNIKGDVSLKTVSGEIRGSDIKATFLETKSVNGSQFLDRITTRRLRIRSHSGAVDFQGIVPEDGFWESSTFDGEMKFRFADDAPLDLEAHSRTGQVNVDETIEAREKSTHYFRGRLGSGQTLVRLTSFEGQIDVRIRN